MYGHLLRHSRTIWTATVICILVYVHRAVNLRPQSDLGFTPSLSSINSVHFHSLRIHFCSCGRM